VNSCPRPLQTKPVPLKRLSEEMGKKALYACGGGEESLGKIKKKDEEKERIRGSEYTQKICKEGPLAVKSSLYRKGHLKGR